MISVASAVLMEALINSDFSISMSGDTPAGTCRFSTKSPPFGAGSRFASVLDPGPEFLHHDRIFSIPVYQPGDYSYVLATLGHEFSPDSTDWMVESS